MKQRGRKSAASITVVHGEGPRLAPPGDLSPAEAQLWQRIVSGFPGGHFSAGDGVLLREFVRTAAILLPDVNARIQEEGIDGKYLALRSMLNKEVMTLAAKLRLNVSARVRGDSASLKKKAAPAGVIDFEGYFSKEKTDAET